VGRSGPAASEGQRPTSAGDLPVEQPSTFEFVVNLQAAGTQTLTIPTSVLQRATEVVQ
jgi:putative tryptophan/tyrosine transport system substrate-binding protein